MNQPELASILEVLSQFIHTERWQQGRLNLEHYHVTLLQDMEKAQKAAQIRWYGGSRIRTMVQQLSGFKAIKQAKVPKRRFKAQLRTYQQQGVNWLQFLRQCGLGGLLADDMGLGKTIQILAHLAIEQQQQRLENPSLIVVPTSVIHNWQQEMTRWTPTLSHVLWHGPQRAEQANSLPTAQIILTTYPLLLRDQATLLDLSYQDMILDEAQHIKNAKTKLASVVQRIQAVNRVCLTGTPIENYLGELWSLFHVLMPGYLGHHRQFKKHYQTPIEKHQDEKKQWDLQRLVKPFMLRRNKEEVAQELPEKTEMIRTIELSSSQRDLYEKIRLTLHQKVRTAIQRKGLRKSQIIILDALLKLRQICCDPRLLKMKAATSVKTSAKLDTLMALIQTLMDEKRRVLLFSQFTQMLRLISAQLDQHQIPYVTLTGKTINRSKVVHTFQQGDVPLFLISLKAGGTGLNLTAADTVIHYDPWWNSAVEQQATDRSYRIGQDKPVFVYKLVTADTVEEKILDLQRKKQALMDGLFTGNTNRGKLTPEDLQGLLET